MIQQTSPIAVDLDGTLIFSDMLFESLVRLIKKNVLYVLLVPFWLLKGKSHLKFEIARRVEVDVTTLPYNQPLIEYLEQVQATRPVYLATATHRLIAEPIAAHFKFFKGCYASDKSTNLKGRHKATALNKAFGKNKYTYVGNDLSDVVIWQDSQSAILVSDSNALKAKAAQATDIEQVFSGASGSLSDFFNAIRVHQWVKNALLFVPLFAAHKLTDVELLMDVALATLAFSFCASSVYLLNDLVDIEADRHHKTKKYRPFAAGTLPIQTGLLGIPVLLCLALSISFFLPPSFLVCLIVYYTATTIYSFSLKQKLLLDVVILAGLFTSRIVAGATASGVVLSEWLLAFSMFFFLSLALVKRYTELVYLEEAGQSTTKGRGYRITDMSIVAAMGVASGYISVLVFALYLNSSAVLELYTYPTLLWGLGPVLLYWISRIWILAQRGQMHDDPIVFAIRDRVSQIMGLLIGLTFLVAQ